MEKEHGDCVEPSTVRERVFPALRGGKKSGWADRWEEKSLLWH